MPPIVDVLFRNPLCLSFQMMGIFLKFESRNNLKIIRQSMVFLPAKKQFLVILKLNLDQEHFMIDPYSSTFLKSLTL